MRDQRPNHADTNGPPVIDAIVKAEHAAVDTACRLCGGRAVHRFSKQVLKKHAVSYFECGACGSLQTETPYWLGEAYNSNLAEIDTGAAQRNLNSMAATLAVCKLFSLRNAVDFGGGDGLLCRLLRDHRINCFVQDRYARTTYAQGFTEPDFQKPDLRLSFEVFEHFSEPRTDLAAIFHDEPDSVFGSTVNYAGQGAEWDYLAEQAGQHVFFYSPQALELIGKSRGYDVMLRGAYFLFVRPHRDNPIKFSLLRQLLRSPSLRVLRTVVSALPAHGAKMDQNAIAGQPPPSTR